MNKMVKAFYENISTMDKIGKCYGIDTDIREGRLRIAKSLFKTYETLDPSFEDLKWLNRENFRAILAIYLKEGVEELHKIYEGETLESRVEEVRERLWGSSE